MSLLRALLRLPAQVVIGLLRAYQLVVSPMLGPVCRYAPSCSSYAVEAVSARGLVVGAALASWRLLRCHPWAAGGWDPVPPCRGGSRAGGTSEHATAHRHTGEHQHENLPGRDRADSRPTPGRTP